MYKTIWYVRNETENSNIELTYYHFGKNPKFPNWYMEKEKVYKIEMLWQFKLTRKPKLFFSCLFKDLVISRG